MALNIQLRPARKSDLESLAAIERESFPDPSWTASDFFLYDCIVAEVEIMPGNCLIAGFLVSRETFQGSRGTPPEREILNLAVMPRFRRVGIARILLAKELSQQATVFLEVRESNVPAIHLYTNAGFTEIDRRLNYYDNPVESAIVMRMKW